MSDYGSFENCIKRLTQNMELCELLMDKSKTIPRDIFVNVMEDGAFVFYDPHGSEDEMCVDYIADVSLRNKASEMMALFKKIDSYKNVEE